jgi:hypothetical protein
MQVPPFCCGIIRPAFSLGDSQKTRRGNMESKFALHGSDHLIIPRFRNSRFPSLYKFQRYIMNFVKGRNLEVK